VEEIIYLSFFEFLSFGKNKARPDFNKAKTFSGAIFYRPKIGANLLKWRLYFHITKISKLFGVIRVISFISPRIGILAKVVDHEVSIN